MISDVKIRYILDKLQKQILKIGDTSQYPRLLQEYVSKAGDLTKPSLKFFKQLFKKPFNIAEHNRMLKEIEEDLDVLYTENTNQMLSSLSLIDRNDLILRRYLSESKTINDLLEFELLTLNGSTGYFFGAFDTFRNLSKIDLDQTTAEVDLGTESVRLPRNYSSTKRYKLTHLLDTIEAPFTNLQEVVSSRTVPGADFSYCLDDLNRAWQQEIVTTNSNGIKGFISIALNADKSAETISTIILDVLSHVSVEIKVYYSQDGLNWLVFPAAAFNYSEANKTRIAAQNTSLAFLRIEFTKGTPDKALENGNYIYYVGLRSLEIYKEAFAPEAVLISAELYPEDIDLCDTINKVSLTVEQELPDGTEIDYFVAASGSDYLEISPINAPKPDVPVVIDFERMKSIPALTNIQTVSSPSAYTFPDGTTSRNGITFYSIYTFPETPNLNTVIVKRGIDGWKVVSNESAPDVKSELDNYLVFTADDNDQHLYINVTEEEVLPQIISSNPTKFNTFYNILDEQQFRSFATSGTHVQRPDYLVGKLILRPGGTSATARTKPVTFNNSSIALPKINGRSANGKVLEFTSRAISYWHPVRRFKDQFVHLSYTVGSNIINHVFKILSVDDYPASNKTVFILDDPTDILLDSSTPIVTFQSLDITEDIERVEATGVTVSNEVEILSGDKCLIDYRRTLSDLDTLLLDTIIVKDQINGSVTYTEGTDYSFDPVTKTLYRNPAGAIRNTARVSFSYKTRKFGYNTYEAYFTVANPAGVEIRTSGITALENESAIFSTNQGNIDLLSSRNIYIPPGTYRLQVTSRPVVTTANILDENSLMYKIVNLVDTAGEYVFSPGRYFNRQEAFNTNMSEVSFPRLVNSVRRNDNSFFAVTEDQLIFNFDPTYSTQVLYLLPGDTEERFEEKIAIGYSLFPSTSVAVPYVIFKAVLRRNTQLQELSPTLYSYNLRFSHI